jgi:hypothetical protein
VESVKVFVMLSVFCVVSWTALRYIFDAIWPAFHRHVPLCSSGIVGFPHAIFVKSMVLGMLNFKAIERLSL